MDTSVNIEDVLSSFAKCQIVLVAQKKIIEIQESGGGEA